MFTSFDKIIYRWLIQLGMSEPSALLTKEIAGVLLILIVSTLAFIIGRFILIKVIYTFTRKTKSNWDDIMFDNKVFSRIAYFLPAWIIYTSIPLVLSEYEVLTHIIQKGISIYVWILVALLISSVLISINSIYETYESSKHKPIKGYVLFVRIVFWTIAAICIVAILLGKDPNAIFVGLGAFAAVLLLVFKDTILGLVGSVQLSSNDMVRIGDWISMPTRNADGTVIDISLTTVKVQNWDKTISTIPTYSLISESFQNWRGMEESGGRRIKRSINIDLNTIKFCTPEMLEKFHKIQLLTGYIDQKQKELNDYNEKHHIDNSVLVNGRRQTNLGVFRAYLQQYLNHLPAISNDMTFLVRQLQPTETGIPVEIYVFSTIQAWGEYENIQADIFDHILSIIPEFDLRAYQSPSGEDIRFIRGN
ncbi:MAG: mechanosensitive ion channel [Bacteroidia bacterium]|nr:mechanosensitive ion channel family protein [Bacteroidales bacterium]NCD40528.1 mechanosensitive ion channel [Bacteroidia bacterium]MDD2322005.1 mechanosensitive ion channel [Bacteroidales bacterium]MDD3009961.1 mechanosensitive ion channel [Bacteroidales bacterium]MDD3960829.1 mechanosensitive ion channel [Bacteroidales bacterium]